MRRGECMKTAVITFPASNCDRDAFTVLSRLTNQGGHPVSGAGNVIKVWHRDTELPKVDLVMLPGGFSYGDYLRSGAMAARSPIMEAVRSHAARGGYVLGVCNGFQLLTESGLLPGTLMRNQGQKFICKDAHLKVENNDTAFTGNYMAGQIITIPIAHHDGCYAADGDTLKALEASGQIAFRYTDASGNATAEANPNGSLANIAGVFNEQKNILGMMPHPERHTEALLGGIDGTALFESLMAA